jgi:ribosome recycling factor
MDSILKDLREKCGKTVEHLKKEAGRMRSGRASPQLLEGLTVEYYGSQVPLIQLGTITAPEPRQLLIQVYDRGAVEAVEKAIQAANLGLNPSKDGSALRLIFPPLTEERRKEMVKTLHKLTEESKVGLRTHRRDAIEALKKLEKAKEMSADDLRRNQEEVQKITDKFVADLDAVCAQKEKEMMEV